MKLNRICTAVFLTLLFSISVFSQDYKKHTVGKGETITQIAQKYKVTPFDIYRINPDSQSGLKENDVILIPASGTATPTAKPSSNAVTHTAKAKETLYSISREYKVTVDQLKAANPILSDGLKVGQVIIIPGAKSTQAATKPVSEPVSQPVTAEVKPSKGTVHVVAPKETKFGIAKKYGITVAELERQNPAIASNLPVGFRLSINGGNPSANLDSERPKPVVTDIQSETVYSTQTVRTTTKTSYANYEVKPKETLFSLSQMFSITEEELIRLNPNLKEGVKIGMILKVPGRGSMVAQQVNDVEDLSRTISGKNRKKLVLLLPFNADKIQGDTLKSVAERLKKDAFLNMTLDFYSGALMAIDSAKALGLNIDVRIYDSGESKTASNVASVIQNYKVSEADAVIGPFYQQHAEKAAELLAVNNVPVISPLSKDTSASFGNLFQAMPSAETTKSAILDYMISKNGNIIVISDPKKVANREFITQNYKDARFAELEANGSLKQDQLRSLFVKDRTNYVIIDSERTGMILGATNLLLNEMANYQIQMAIIEPNETLDFEEISMKRLTILKMIYPSVTRDNESPAVLQFENDYRQKNKIFPSQYAVRGFDVTFDTMLRLSQEKGFLASAAEDATEQVESKFQYMKKDADGFINKGVYILQYNDDLTVKVAE